jgi:hypothetical protein
MNFRDLRKGQVVRRTSLLRTRVHKVNIGPEQNAKGVDAPS